MSNKTSDNSVANIEENIKTIKNLLQMLENGFLTEEMCPIRSWDPTPKYASALKYILAEREQKDKRIQELEEQLNYRTNKFIEITNLYLNSIPKQAVIDKIKEYDKKMEEDAGHPNWVVTDRIVMNVLQELLETK